LVLADFDDDISKPRLEERNNVDKEAPWGDDDFAKILEKRDLYRYFFNNSKIKNKFLIDTSQTTVEEAVDEIRKEFSF